MKAQSKEYSDSGASHEAQELADVAVSAFAGITGEMGRIRTLHGEITQSLTEFAELVESAESVDTVLADLQTRVGALATALERFRSTLSNPQTGGRINTTRTTLVRIAGNGRSLEAISTLTRTTAASLGVAKMDNFVQELKQTASRIRSDADDVLRGLENLRAGFRQMAQSCRQALDDMQDLPAELDRDRTAIGTLERDEARAASELSSRALRLVSGGKANLKVFVTAMQFSDRLAQRLDHLDQMLAMDDPHVHEIARAQALDCRAAIQDIADEVRETMQDMARTGREGATLFSEGAIADMIAETMSRRTQVIDAVRAQVVRIDHLLDEVQTDADRITQAGVAATESIDTLTDSSERLAAASVNSLLLASHIGDLGAPLIVLSKEVRQVATQCLEDVKACQQQINDLTRDSEADHGQLSTASSQLTEAIKAQEGLHASGEARLTRINTLRNTALGGAETLLTLVDEVDTGMAALDDVGRALGALKVNAQGLNTVPPDPEFMARIWDMYTMEEERSVHRSLYPDIPPAEDSPEAAPDEDDLDDLFF